MENRASRGKPRVDYARLGKGIESNDDDEPQRTSRASGKRTGGLRAPDRIDTVKPRSMHGTQAASSSTAGSSAAVGASDARVSERVMPDVRWEKWDRFVRRVQSQISRMKLAETIMDVYEGSGWKGARLEKSKPEGELISASMTIVDAKRKMRAVLAEAWSVDASHNKYSQFTGWPNGGSHVGDLMGGTGGAALHPMAEAPKGSAAASRHAAAVSASLHQLVGAAGGQVNSDAGDGASIDAEEIGCSACGHSESTDDNDILCCDYAGCGRCYHMACLDPPVSVETIQGMPEEGDWVCRRCACLVACIGEINDLCSKNFDGIAEVWADVDIEDARVRLRQDKFEQARRARLRVINGTSGASGSIEGADAAVPLPEGETIASRRIQRAASVAARQTDEWRSLAAESLHTAQPSSSSSTAPSGQANDDVAGEEEEEVAEGDSVGEESIEGDGKVDEEEEEGEDEPYNEDEDEDFGEEDAVADECESGGDEGSHVDFGSEKGDEDIDGSEPEEDVQAEIAALRAEAGVAEPETAGSEHEQSFGSLPGPRQLRRREVVDYISLAAKIYGEEQAAMQDASLAAEAEAASRTAGANKKRPRGHLSSGASGGVLARIMQQVDADEAGEGLEEDDASASRHMSTLASLLGGGALADDEEDEDWHGGVAKKRKRTWKAKVPSLVPLGIPEGVPEGSAALPSQPEACP